MCAARSFRRAVDTVSRVESPILARDVDQPGGVSARRWSSLAVGDSQIIQVVAPPSLASERPSVLLLFRLRMRVFGVGCGGVLSAIVVQPRWRSSGRGRVLKEAPFRDETAPDHWTLTELKRRTERQGKEALLEELLQEVVMMAVGKGMEFGDIQVVDRTHTVADVNVPKDDRRRNQGQSPRDGRVRLGVKVSRSIDFCRRIL